MKWSLMIVGLLLSQPAGAVLVATPRPSPPLCRVTAEYRPAWWGSDFRRVTVQLAPGCPPNGIARVRLGGYGGPGSRAVGPIETLNQSRPRIEWAAQPEYRTVLWEAASGKTYLVPLREVRR